MKAAELLKLYEAGRRDFSGESLRGQNFKGKDLSGADFSGADIRSANFTNANLTGANFTQAKAGLQRRWMASLLGISILLSAVSGFLSALVGLFVALIFDSSSLQNQVAGWVSIAILVVFCIITLREGVAAGASVGAGAFAVAGAFAFAFAGACAFAGAFAFAFAGAVTVAVAVAVAVAAAVAVAVAFADTVAFAAAVVAAVSVTLLSAYIGWRALGGDPRDAWIRSAAVALAAIGGTSFRDADLTDADFSQAQLKSADLRRATLLRTCWRNAVKLDRVRSGETYLNNLKIQQLLLTGDGQGQAFDYLLNLQGINLQGANLVKADFTGSNLRDGNLQGANLSNSHLINTNLNNVNFQDVNLSNAKLVQAQLDQANLMGATLTGACIEDWNITTSTQLSGIRCDYVFMRQLPDDDLGGNPHRKPDDWQKIFADGEFVDFIAPMVETLDLYHNQTVDPRAVAIAFSDLRKQNPDADLEIVSMEKRGSNLDKFNLRVRTSPQADCSQLHHQYFDRYEHLLTLPPHALVALLMEKEGSSQKLARLLETAITQPRTQIENYQNQGDTTVSEQGSNSSKYDLSNAQFAGGFAETVQGNQIGGNITNQAAETPSLAEAAAEIQQLLKQLEASNPTATEAEQTAFLSALIPPTRRERFIGALKSGSSAAIDEIPYGPVLKALVEGWQRPKE